MAINQNTPGATSANGDAGTQPGSEPVVSKQSPEAGRGQREYAEAIANPLPELVVMSEPEHVSNLDQPDCQDDAESTRPVVQPDDIGDRRGAAVVYAGEKPSRWRKYRTVVIIGLVAAVLILVGVIVGVVVSSSNKDHVVAAGGIPSTSIISTRSTSATATSSTTTSSSSAASSSTASSGSPVRSAIIDTVSSSSPSPPPHTVTVSVFPTTAPTSFSYTEAPSRLSSQVPVPSECADSSKFLTKVSFMGIKGAPGNGGWKTSYYGASDAEDCCAHCFTGVDAGCNSWAYMPSGGFVGTACAMITGWETGDNEDGTCPAGHGAAVYFTQGAAGSSDGDVGAPGPCGDVAE